MKKAVVAAVLVLAAVPLHGQAAPRAQRMIGITFSTWVPPGVYIEVYASEYRDVATGAVVWQSATAIITDQYSSEYFTASTIALQLDPGLVTGSLTATLTGSSGLAVIDVDFLGTQVTSNPPFTAVELLPATSAVSYSQRSGHVAGSVTTVPGSYSLTNVRAFAQQSVDAAA